MSVVDTLVEQTLGRLKRHTERDVEFERHFGSFTRPPHLPRYNLEQMKHLVSWSPFTEGIIEVAPFIRALEEPDRVLAAEIAKFTHEQFLDKPASDKILHDFTNHFFRRLDICGF